MHSAITQDLFDDTPAPISTTRLEIMFDDWAYSREAGGRPGFSPATSTVMRSMWMAFGAWCSNNRLDPLTVTSSELDAYLKSREGADLATDLSLRYSWRLVTLIDKILQHAHVRAFTTSQSASQPGPDGDTDQLIDTAFIPAQATTPAPVPTRAASDLLASNTALRWANAYTSDPLPEFLTDSQDRALIGFLVGTIPHAGKNAGPLHGQSWQDVRNRTGVALQRGAGLTPLELRTLTLSSLYGEPDPHRGIWKVRAPATGSVAEHDAPLAAWARPLLAHWLELRLALGIPGEWLFPSTKSGKPWGKTAHFEAVAAVLSGAGLIGYKGASYLLRHTFAIKQLSRPGSVDAKVAAWLGIDESEMSRYKKVLSGPVDVL